MIGLKTFLNGIFICVALLLLHVQPSFGRAKIVKEIEKEQAKKPNEKAVFNEVAKEDIETLKEYLEHEEEHKGKLSKNSADDKEIIKTVMNRLVETDINCEKVGNHFKWKCDTIAIIRDNEVNWLNFLRNRDTSEKEDEVLEYLAVRPVVKENKSKNGPAKWEKVGLKEVLELIENYAKTKQHPTVEYSLDNVQECSFIKSLVHKLDDDKKIGNEKKIEETKEELRNIYEKEENVLCGKGDKFTEETHQERLKHRIDHAWQKIVVPMSRLESGPEIQDGGMEFEADNPAEDELQKEETEESEGKEGAKNGKITKHGEPEEENVKGKEVNKGGKVENNKAKEGMGNDGKGKDGEEEAVRAGEEETEHQVKGKEVAEHQKKESEHENGNGNHHRH